MRGSASDPTGVLIRLDPDGERVETVTDPGDAVFDNTNVPFLTYGDQAGRWGWCLSFFEDDSPTAGVEIHFFPGEPDDQARAVEDARQWLSEYGPG